MENNNSLISIEERVKIGNVPVEKIDSTELLPNVYTHQYKYWKGIFLKKNDFDVGEVFRKNDIRNYADIISVDGRTEVIIKDENKNYDKLIKFYASRNILLERGILEKEDKVNYIKKRISNNQ